MVIEHKTWECKICHRQYHEKKRAVACEKKGSPKPKFFKGVAGCYDSKIYFLLMDPEICGHELEWNCHWFRDTGSGDNLEGKVQRLSEDAIAYRLKNKIGEKSPAWKRLKKFCERENIILTKGEHALN